MSATLLDTVRGTLRLRPQLPLFVQPAAWDAELDQVLREADPAALFGSSPLKDPHAAACALAGVHLWNDAFDTAHDICQSISTQTGSYWHGLCHRREGHRGEGLTANLSNARYWFRRVGTHPAYDPLLRGALRLLDQAGAGFRWATEAAASLRSLRQWDPFALIDWFAQADAQSLSPQTTAVLEEIQRLEIESLVEWCVQQAR